VPIAASPEADSTASGRSPPSSDPSAAPSSPPTLEPADRGLDGAPPPEGYDPADYRWVPVRRRPRTDGWTEEKQRRFIEVLADTGLVSAADKGGEIYRFAGGMSRLLWMIAAACAARVAIARHQP
jgi:hypothetical protein